MHDVMSQTQDIQDEIQELLTCETLLSDLDLESISVTKTPSFVDYTVCYNINFKTMVLTSPKKTTTSTLSNEAAQLLSQIKDELNFESKYFDQTSPPKPLNLSDFQDNDPTIGWCCKYYLLKLGICDQDALVFCPGCDNDRYCSDCFRKGHREGEYAKHLAKKLK